MRSHYEDTITALSPCGNYVARASAANLSLEIFDVPMSSSGTVQELYRSYNLIHAIRPYGGKRIEQIGISQVEWEIRDEQSPMADKVAIVVESHALLLIYDIRQITEPIVIEQSRAEGIERVQWIPPVIETGELGAYTNSKQIALFTKHQLELKVYSLDCTRVLFTIPKPISSALIVRPNAHNRFWSVLADTFLVKHTNVMIVASADRRPLMLHFYNEGSSSRFLYKMKLPLHAITACEISWSPSGKWFHYFNDTQPLFGYDLQVFNVFGVFKKPLKDIDAGLVAGDSILHLNWLTDGVVRDVTSSSLVSFGSTHYLSRWIQASDDIGLEECILVACVNESAELEAVLISMDTLKVRGRWLLPNQADESTIWRQTGEGRPSKYRKIAKCQGYSLSSSHQLQDIHLDIGGAVIFRFDTCLLIYKLVKGPDVELEWHLHQVIETSNRILGVEALAHEEDPVLLITAEDHIAIYDLARQTTTMAMTNTRKIKQVSVFASKDQMRFVICDHVSTSRANDAPLNQWHSFMYDTSQNTTTQTDARTTSVHDEAVNEASATNYEDDSNAEIMNRFQYKEEDSRIMNLMRDVQHTEWGQRARIRRSRLSDGRMSGVRGVNARVNELASDDITDTFNLHRKKPRRTSGL